MFLETEGVVKSKINQMGEELSDNSGFLGTPDTLSSGGGRNFIKGVQE